MNLDSVNLDALYLVKLIFGEYFCYFDSNRVTVLLHLQLYLDANRVPVHERVNALVINNIIGSIQHKASGVTVMARSSQSGLPEKRVGNCCSNM